MTIYGKPIYVHDEFDGYDDITMFCDECGEECNDLNTINSDYEICNRCLAIKEDKESEILNL